MFLVENNIKLNLQTKSDKKTALMSIASIEPSRLNDEALMEGMVNVCKKILINYTASDLNIQDSNGNTCLHIAINSNNKIIFKEILKLGNNKLNMDIKNNLNELPLWLALLRAESESKQKF
jgi:ankyrin repeat protein